MSTCAARIRDLFPLPILLAASMLLVSCGRTPPSVETKAPAPASKPIFVDITAESGLDFTYRNGEESDRYTILESLGGGVGLIDFDRDGLLDIFLTGGGYFGPDTAIQGHPCKLFRNEGNWKFRDVSTSVGLDKIPRFYSHGVAVGDFDSDGWPDLLVTGYGRLALLRNTKGIFHDITAGASLTDPGPLHWSTSAAWGDFNRDGKLDLVVGHYVDWSFQNHPKCAGYNPAAPVDVCPPERFKPLPPALYFGHGDGTFALQKDAGLKPAKALGVVAADLDADGQLDFYFANDAFGNHLYLGQGQGRFVESAGGAGVAFDSDGRPTGSMGVDVADYEGAGRLSLFVANFENETHCLYRNLGNGQFLCSSRLAGITSIGLKHVGFGTAFLDFDNDGRLDLILANGHVVRHPAANNRLQKPVLFRNEPTTRAGKEVVRFTDVSAEAGAYFQGKYLGRGVAVGDLDNDGRPDVVVSHMNTPVALLRNDVNSAHGWLGVTLEAKAPRDPIGAVATLTQGPHRQVRLVKGGGSYLSTSDARMLFTWRDKAGPAELKVRWPSGREETWSGDALTPGRYQKLVEGTR